MSPTYIIETRKGAAGIVVRDGHGFRFFSATADCNSLDGRLFATPKDAEAAVDHLHGPKAPSFSCPCGPSLVPQQKAGDGC
jgi:hypothetical protein